MMDKSHTVVLRDTTFPSGIKSTLTASINEKEELVIEGYDIGEKVKEMWGDSDYEYWLIVPQEAKDTVLLALIKEKFTDESEFREWLKNKNIPFTFDSYI